MAGGCSIRAVWILNNQDAVVYSRRFPVVERRWRLACDKENESAAASDSLKAVSDGIRPPVQGFYQLSMVSENEGTVSTSEQSVEWRIIVSGRGVSGKSIEAIFPGTLKFAPWQTMKLPSLGSAFGSMDDESNMVNVEDFLMEKRSKDLEAVDLEEPFCWQAYSYAKVSFKMVGTTLSGMSIDPKSVSIFPAVKAPVEISAQISLPSKYL